MGERFGWSKLQIDEVLRPVIRSLQKSTGQSRIDSYFTSYRATLPDKGLQSSKRVEEALRKVKGLPKSPVKKCTGTTISPRKPANQAKQSTPPLSLACKLAGSRKTTKVKSSTKTTAATTTVTAGESSGASTSTSTSADTTSVPDVALSDEAKAANVSLIAKSSGFVLANSPDDIILQRIEREKAARMAKARAAEIFRKSEAERKRKHAKRFKRPARVELARHGLSSDEEEDNTEKKNTKDNKKKDKKKK